MRNNIYSNDGTALSCGKGASFASRDCHLLFGNTSDGCAAGDPNGISADPSHVSAATGCSTRVRRATPPLISGSM